MDEQTTNEFNRILSKPIGELTPEDKGFLQARQSYMGRKTKEQYKEVLGEKIIIDKPEEQVADTNPFPSSPDDGQDEIEE
jgi:hypothetical protein